MKLNKVTLVVLTTLPMSVLANVDVNQNGSGNLASINQTGNSTIQVTQDGTTGNVVVNQTGDENTINIWQSGSAVTTAPIQTVVSQTNAWRSNIDLGMDGFDDEISIATLDTSESWINVSSGEGGNNSLTVTQTATNQSGLSVANSGSFNTWTINQTASGSNIEVFSTSNGHLTQGNSITVNQSGSGNFVRTHIEGDNNQFDITQDATDSSVQASSWGVPDPFSDPAGPSSNNVMTITQTGNNNDIQSNTSDVNGVFDHTFTVTQSGSFNSIDVGGRTDASFNEAFIDQSGDNSFVRVDFSGNGHSADITQTGSFSSVEYFSFGSGNNFVGVFNGNNQFHNITQAGTNNVANVTVN